MKRLYKKLLISAFIMVVAVVTSTGYGGATTGGGGYHLLIEAFPGGSIMVVGGHDEVLKLGSVLSLPSTTRWPAFTASKWGKPGTVVATAVNALHILVDIKNGQGETVSILPRDSFAPAAGENTYYLTDIPPGRGLFGAWAPTVGSRVIFRENGPAGKGTTRPSLEIIVPPEATPWFVEIENRPGGRIIAWTNEGAQLLGRVVRPLAGCGRFGGTQFQRTGRIRANHPGVIDISTSPEGMVGGFQILPLEHASSPEMKSAWKLSQWLIVAPEKGTFTGKKPLFSSGFVPGPATGEKLWDLWSTYGRKSLVLVRENGGPWKWMPQATGRDDTALEGVTHLRLYFPSTKEPLKAAGTP
ncbi:MAG: hypothetical protein ACP5CD_02735 [Thermovirgaceae bacterium]